ncbi:hypothetical protein H0H81_001820 [Sphagnurus paluster]|uniref:BTB domain-containing protein n=1 Tax=Sphagnurus paluster TaxID=117069 RepID=A0A9P7GM47_9AGAR|nr:hypothetical protein H0H81_001820 [Sphagnurus paluster]
MVKSKEFCEIIASGAKTEDTPVVLEGVTKYEFDTLLELMYPLYGFKLRKSQSRFLTDLYRSEPGVPQRSFSHQEWGIVLKLASRWMFSALRRLAITNLSSHSWTVKVPLARAYGVCEWLHSAYTDLASRSTSPTIDEATVLGLDATAILFAIREEPLQRNRDLQLPKGNDNPFENGVDEEFAELDHEGEDAVQKVLIAKQQAVAPEWLRTAYIRLVERKKAISIVEAEQLGLETTVKVCRAREKALGTYPKQYGSSNLTIEKEFEHESDDECSNAHQDGRRARHSLPAVINFAISEHVKTGHKVWPIPWGAGIVLFGLLAVKELPRWLASVGRTRDALGNLVIGVMVL